MSFTKHQHAELRSMQIQDSRFAVHGFWHALRAYLVERCTDEGVSKAEAEELARDMFSAANWRIHPDGFTFSGDTITWYEFDHSSRTGNDKLLRIAALDDLLSDCSPWRIDVVVIRNHRPIGGEPVVTRTVVDRYALDELCAGADCLI